MEGAAGPRRRRRDEASRHDRQLTGEVGSTPSTMPSWFQPIERWLVRLEKPFCAPAIPLLVGCGALICVDVAMRYVFSRPILGGIEIVEYALVYITFLGASWAVPRGAH